MCVRWANLLYECWSMSCCMHRTKGIGFTKSKSVQRGSEISHGNQFVFVQTSKHHPGHRIVTWSTAGVIQTVYNAFTPVRKLLNDVNDEVCVHVKAVLPQLHHSDTRVHACTHSVRKLWYISAQRCAALYIGYIHCSFRKGKSRAPTPGPVRRLSLRCRRHTQRLCNAYRPERSE